jgi:hypothetical protein
MDSKHPVSKILTDLRRRMCRLLPVVLLVLFRTRMEFRETIFSIILLLGMHAAFALLRPR